MADKFKPGDQVVLKSGGPAMTIDSTTAGGSIWAIWFAGAKRERANFHVESLDPAPAKPEPKK